LLRGKRKEIAKDEPIRCVVDTEHSAEEISGLFRRHDVFDRCCPARRSCVTRMSSAFLASAKIL